MAKKREETKEFFVGIENATSLRRDLLESLKLSIRELQSIHRITQVRKEKLIYLNQLRKIMKSITSDFDAIKVELPQVRVPRASPVVEDVEEIETPDIPEDPELGKLAQELQDIEDKLNSL